MGQLVQANLRLRSDLLAPALRRLIEVSPRLASHIANKACFSIAWRAEKTMPVVSPAKIASELMASKPPKRVGKLVGSGSLRRGWRFGGQTSGPRENVPLLALIINARVLRVDNAARSQPGLSRYNRLTGMVFARMSSPFRGKSRKAGGAAMLAAMKRVLSARRSSSGFYKLGAAVVKFIFARNPAPVRVPPGVGSTTGEATPGTGNVSNSIGRVAGGTRATGNSARASFWITTTEPDSKGSNRGINQVLNPTWQRAVDSEAAAIAAYAEKLYAQSLREAGFTVK